MAPLFLPFTPQGKGTEELAIRVKKRLRLGPYDAVRPFEALEMVPARVLNEFEISRLPPPVQDVLFRHYCDCWSAVGIGVSPASGDELILLNPTHHDHRTVVSLMEEIVHIVLGHPRVALQFDGRRVWKRPFESRVEDEAFSVGAACMIPYRNLFNRVKDGQSAEQIAAEFGVSVPYVEYRLKRAGLYRMYGKAVRR